jgi:hypothetical protein
VNELRFKILMPLHPLPTDRSWSVEIITSVRIINDIYQQATAALQIQSSKERYISHADLIMNTAIPLLTALSDSPEDIPTHWFDSTTRKIGNLIADLEQAELEADGVCVLYGFIWSKDDTYMEPITSGKCRTWFTQQRIQ